MILSRLSSSLWCATARIKLPKCSRFVLSYQNYSRVISSPSPIYFHRSSWNLHCGRLPVYLSRCSLSSLSMPMLSAEVKGNFSENVNLAGAPRGILTIPNVLTLSRICAAPYIAYLVISGANSTAFCLFFIAGLTDYFDGYIARRYPSQRSVIGSILDPLADKVLITCLVVALTYNGAIPVWLSGLILLRDVCLVSGGAYLRYASLPPPKTFFRYLNPRVLSTQIHPLWISKFNTWMQMGMIVLTTAAPVFGIVGHPAVYGVQMLTAGTTVASGVAYIIYRKSFSQFKRLLRD